MLTDFLKLDRPLIALDVETHDKVPPEQSFIVELGFVVLYPDGREPKRWVSLIRPPVPIAESATLVHHITNDDVTILCTRCRKLASDHPNTECEKWVGAPPFASIAANIAKGFSSCDFCGYNVQFDLKCIGAEMGRANVSWSSSGARLLDGLALWRKAVPRTLSDAVRTYLKRKTTDAHRALGDAEDALDVAEGMLLTHEELPRDIQKLHDLCFVDAGALDPDKRIIWRGEHAVINFGKHNGTPLKDVPRTYLEWMIGGNFSPEVRVIVNAALQGTFPVKPNG